MNYRTIGIRKDPAAPAIVELADYEQLCGGSGPDIGSGITPQALRDLLDAEAGIVLIDVREPAEWQINRIDGAHLIPLSAIASGAGLDQLPADRVPVLYCKSGIPFGRGPGRLAPGRVRQRAAPGGRHPAWAEQFEPDMAMY